MRTALVALFAAVGLVATADRPASAQQPPAASVQTSSAAAPAQAVTSKPEVIINATRPEFVAKVHGFVDQLTDFSNGDTAKGLARWQEPACPLVTGLPQQQGEYILGRLSDIAQAAGAPLGSEKCRPNLFIIVTKQPVADLRNLDKQHHVAVFGEAAPEVVDNFIATPRPVRTWYISLQRTPEGLPLQNMSFPGISQQKSVVVQPGVVDVTPVRPGDSTGTLTNPWSQASHLSLNAVWAIQRVFVIVDPTQFKGVSLGQLADYVAMAGLAQIKLDPQVAGDPTILTLFDKANQTPSPGLTDWDRAFLKSVYSTEAKSVLQRTQIAETMIQDISASP
jgi:hypothetical protein